MLLLWSDQLYASMWMMGSAFLYSLQNADARFSGDVFGFWTMCVFRGLVGSIVCGMLLFFSKKDDAIFSHQNTRLLMLRSILGGATIITSFFAILKCDLSTTTVITSTASLWTALLGYMISPIKYKWEVHDLIIALWCIAGIVIVSSNQHEGVYYYMGIISAILSAIFQSGVNLTIKQLDNEHPAWVALWGMMGSIVLGLPGLIYEVIQTKPHFTEATPWEWVSLITTGILSASAQYCKTHSIQISHSMSILILRYMDTIFSVVWDVLLFHQHLHWQTMTGISIILSGCLAKFGIEYRQQQQKTIMLLPVRSTTTTSDNNV
jgi:drug/metabolite transporter (DMT)-like permease